MQPFILLMGSHGKYVYPKENMQEIEEFFNEHIEKLFPEAEIKYLV
ncbi:MAG: hypothetical protein K9L17_10955 [Clostridiales bacterium]|nr:hypothetical protein [Clostridiales bacterium]